MVISVVAAQFPVLSIRENLVSMRAVLEQTRVGDLVVFPEGAVSGYSTDVAFLKQICRQELQASLDRLRNEAMERKITIWAGACLRENGQWFNTACGFTPTGQMHVYHKINLAVHERGVLMAGDDLPVFELSTPMGVVSVGVQICRELRFPEQWKALARHGAQAILHLNNAVGDDRYQPVWRSHLVSRAAETQRFVVSVNNAAPQQVSPTLIVAPDGQVMGECVSALPQMLRVSLDLSQVSNWYLDQSRTDLEILGF